MHTARLPQDLVARSALLERWLPLRTRTCHLLLGPAGSGKTSLALQWRARLVGMGFDVVWLQATPHDTPDQLLRALRAACTALAPDFGERLQALGPAPSHDAVAAALVQAVARHPRALLVAVDDYQHVAQHAVHALFQTLLDYAPANLHLLFVARALPPLALEPLAARQQLHRLDAEDLRLGFAETRAWVQRHAPDLPAEHIRRLHVATGGWAMGLQIALHGAPEDNTHYFNQEVLPRLDAESLRVLVRLAPAHSFHEALVLELGGSTVAQSLLARLRRERLFVAPVDTQGWWRLHPMFRALLLERFGQMPQELQQRTRLQLGRWFGARGMLREAVAQLVAAGEAEQAADAVEQQARTLFLGGELQRLARALAALPEPQLHARRALALWQAWSQLCWRRFDACRASIARLAHEPTADDAAQQAHLCLLRFSLALQHDDLDAAQALLPELLELPPHSDAVLHGGRRHLLAWTFSHLGLGDEARERLQGPAHYLDDGRLLMDSCFGSGMTPVMRGLSLLHEGSYRAAESCLRGALAEAEAALGPHSEAASNAAGLLCEVLYEVNDHAGLRRLLAQYASAIERLGLPDVQLGAALAASRLHARAGALAPAHAALDRIEDTADARGMPRIAAVLLHERLRLCLQAHADGAARTHLGALEALAARTLAAHGLAAQRVAPWAQLARARWHLHQLQDEAAQEPLHALLASAQPGSWLRLQAGALAALSKQRSGQPHAALRGALQVLQQAQTMGAVCSLHDLGPDFLRLVQQLQGGADPLLDLYAERLLQQAGPPPAAAPAAPLAALSTREQQILQLLVHDLPNRRIAQALGLSTETVRWHLKNIFAKLAVLRRQDAIVAARGMGIQPAALAP
ncbi:LuxR C-terminal-related transcriptional regulator [Pseudorhodoferax sp.]|uniref:LuxR C-terminal-related transcriptional regulator n=1 Tax=Pseudorhodoferax sp. TaxID=1993553 RepID=UPI002DD6B24E|nr:LuxR C-terminal-related transcriptional regulator [Pseudorhodoferax sp.]